MVVGPAAQNSVGIWVGFGPELRQIILPAQIQVRAVRMLHVEMPPQAVSETTGEPMLSKSEPTPLSPILNNIKQYQTQNIKY